MATTNNKDVQAAADEVVEDVKAAVEAKAGEFDVNEVRREALARADEVRKEAAKKLNTAAETIRKEVREADADSEAVARADDVARHLERTATYLSNNTIEQIGEDATEVVVENPWRAVLVALVVGFVFGMIMRRK